MIAIGIALRAMLYVLLNSHHCFTELLPHEYSRFLHH